MAPVQAILPQATVNAHEDDRDLIVQSDLERQVLTVLRRLDDESQAAALIALHTIERKLRRQQTWCAQRSASGAPPQPMGADTIDN